MSFNFAWVDASETTFDPSVHNREDEDVFGFTVEHSEGDFAGLEIEIRNPRVGLLAPARKVHAFLSYNTGSEIKARSPHAPARCKIGRRTCSGPEYP
jgi:hypothetical protein